MNPPGVFFDGRTPRPRPLAFAAALLSSTAALAAPSTAGEE